MHEIASKVTGFFPKLTTKAVGISRGTGNWFSKTRGSIPLHDLCLLLIVTFRKEKRVFFDARLRGIFLCVKCAFFLDEISSHKSR